MVRIVKLAWRTVFSWRRSIRGTYASVVIATAIVVLTGSAIEPLRHAVYEIQRRSMGELLGVLDGSAAVSLAERISPVTAVPAAHTGAVLASISRTSAAAIDLDDELILTTAVRADLYRELRFRGAYDLAADLQDDLAAGDAVLVAERDLTTSLEGRAIRLLGDGEASIVRIVGTVRVSRNGPQLLIHDPSVDPAAGTYLVRLRGHRGTLARLEALPSAAGLSATRWVDQARHAVAPVRNAGAVLALVLAGLGVAALVPGNMLLARRTRSSRLLLTVWGFPHSTLSTLVILVGAIGGAVAAVTGSAAGLAIAAVMNAQGRAAAGLLPLGLADELEALAPGVSAAALVTPSIAWAAACVGVTTLLGAVAALPAALRDGTLQPGEGVRHWQ